MIIGIMKWQEGKHEKSAKRNVDGMDMFQKGGHEMKKWLLTCSIDAVDIDYETVIESEKEPDFWTCENIAREHGCDWWTLEECE